MSIDAELNEFLERTRVKNLPAAISNAWQAAAQVRRYRIYKESSDKFRGEAKTVDKIHDYGSVFADKLSKLKATNSSMSEKELFTEIHKFQEWTKRNSDSLGFLSDGVSFGVSQKYLNLLAKFLWALKKAPCPPHGPIDRTVLAEIVKKLRPNNRPEAQWVSQLAWTKMTEDQYKRLIPSALKVAQDQKQKLAEWELVVWNNSKR